MRLIDASELLKKVADYIAFAPTVQEVKNGKK